MKTNGDTTDCEGDELFEALARLLLFLGRKRLAEIQGASASDALADPGQIKLRKTGWVPEE